MAAKGKSKEGSSAAGRTSLDVEGLRQIVEILEASEISRLHWVNGSERLTIRRGPPETRVVQHVAAPVPAGPAVTVMPAHASAAVPAQASNEIKARPSAPTRGPVESAGEKKGHLITSPFVGTFYRSPSPDQPAYAEVGSVVKKGQVLCIIEAMKLMNEIESEVSGRVAEVLPQNGQPVEFGQPLFRIEPA